MPVMRHGVSVESQKQIAEQRRQGKRVLSPEAEGMADIPPETVDLINPDDGTGGQTPMFVLGLHDPFDTNHPTMFPGG